MNGNLKTDPDQSFRDSLQKSNLDFDNLENVIYFLDCTNNKYDYMNSAIVDLTGYTMEELNEIGFASIVKDIEGTKSLMEVSQRSLSSDIVVEDYSAKYLIETKTGGLKWVEDISFARLNRSGQKDSCIGILRNITPLNNLINELRDEKQKLDRILDLAEIMFIIIDPNNDVKFINKKGCSILGINRDEVIDKNWTNNFVPSERREEVNLLLQKIFCGEIKNFESYENPVITKNGEKKLISWHNSVLTENGKITLLISSGQDVTNRRREENMQQVISEILQAANSEKNIEEFFKFIHLSICKLMPAENFYIALLEKETNLIKFPYFVDQYDKEAPPKRLGRGLTEYILRTGKSSLVSREMDNLLVQQGETELMGTPSAIWLGIPLKILDNTIGVLVVQDYDNENTYGEKEKEILEVISYPISRAMERKIVEQERDELISKLKDLNESKDKLFSLISHDLRSPFNSLLGFSEILTSEFDTLTHEEIKEYLNVIYESSKNLFSMTNNLLQFSRFQMGRFEFNPVKLNIRKVVLSSVNMLKGNAIKKQLSLSTNIDFDVEVIADEDMLNSIIQNLLSNAIKFTQRGGEIKISGKILKSTDQNPKVEISVDDSGVGITPENIIKIFKDHIHSTPGTEKEYGTGLGLLLVKEFVEINGGKIKVTSKPGRGTSFIFTLPVGLDP